MTLSDEEHLDSLETGKAILLELAEGDPDRILPNNELSKVARALPPGSQGRWDIIETLLQRVRERLGDDKADHARKAERDIEFAQVLQEWLKDNGGYEKVPIYEAPIETAYQRYIRQG